MATGILSSFGDVGTIWTILKWIGYFIVSALFGIGLTALVVMLKVKSNATKIVEMDMQTKQIRTFTGREKKTQKGTRQFWVGKLRRYLPQFQSSDYFMKGKQKTVILLKDNNGLNHTLRIPTYKQLKKWYEVVYDVDITEAKDTERIRSIYCLPNPHEDLDWLANQIAEAKKEFKIDHWWQSPTVAYIATGFICMITFFGTIILSRRL